MVVVEVQLGLPPKTNKKRGSNYITAEEEILVIEEILKYEGTTLFTIESPFICYRYTK